MIFINNSIFILNNKIIPISKVNYSKDLISIKTDKYVLNLSFSKNLDLNLLKINDRVNISEYLYIDQNFVSPKYSYVIDIGKDVFITRKSEKFYLLAVFIPHVDVLIPPFNNQKHIREALRRNEISKLEIKTYFKTL